MSLSAEPALDISQRPRAHQGILRDETRALRRLLGYAHADEDAELETGTELQNSSLKDALFLAIDIDTFQGYETAIPDQQFHIGASVLDTRSLRDLVCAWPAVDQPESAIKSYQYTIGTSRYCRRAARRFLFGASEPIGASDLASRLQALAEGRDSVLVLHGADSDLKALRNLAVDLRPLCVIDTVKAAQFPLDLHYRPSLENLLEELEIPFGALHSAGNDAHFALRALLMLAVRDAERLSLDVSGSSLFRVLAAIAQAPRPATAGEIEAPLIEARRQYKFARQLYVKVKREAKKERKKARRGAMAAASRDIPACDVRPALNEDALSCEKSTWLAYQPVLALVETLKLILCWIIALWSPR